MLDDVPTNDTLEQIEKQKRAFNKLAFLLGATILVVIFYLIVGFQQNNNSIVTTAWLLLGLALAEVISMVLVRRGRFEQGMWLTFISMMIVWPVSVFIISGFGLLLGLTLPIFILSLATDVLPQRQITTALFAAFFISVFTILIDYFGPSTRAEVPDFLQTFLPVVAASVIIVYVIIILRQFKNYSMRAKLITATAVVAIVAVITVTVVVDFTTRSALINQVGTNLNGLANSQALAIGELMSRQVNTLESLGLNRALRDALGTRSSQYTEQTNEEIQAELLRLNDQWQTADDLDPLVLSVLNNSTSGELKSFLETFPDHIRLILADERGAVVAATQRPSQFLNENETWWQNAYVSGFGSVYISEPYQDPNVDDVVVDIAIPVRSFTSDGRAAVGGVLVSTYRLSPLADVMINLGQEQNTEQKIYFQDGQELGVDSVEGTIVYELKQADEETYQQLTEIIDSGAPFFQGEFEEVQGLLSLGQVNTLAHEPQVDRLGWQTAIFQPEAVALASVTQQQQTNILLGVAIVILATATAAVVANFLARPITELTETVSQVAKGDLSARANVKSKDEIGVLALSVNQMAEQLQQSIEGLEQRIEERTRALATSVEVSRSLSTFLDPSELIVEVVEQVRAAFDYYYVQIYLLDENEQTLQIFAGTGDAGQAMLAQGHKLNIGQGLVGKAASANEPVFIPDVSQSDSWHANPLLPDTKAEIAVPIVLGDQVLGVIDVQHDVTSSLTENDVSILQSVAYQVAVALHNARSFERTRKRAEHEATLNAIGQRIRNTTSIDDVLKIAVEELGRAVGNQKTRIELHNPARIAETNGRQN